MTLNDLLETVEHGSVVVTAAPSNLAAWFAASGAALGRISPSPPPGVSVETSPFDAAIRRGGRDLIRTSEGVAFAAWRPGGRLTHALVLSALDGFRAPPPAGPLTLYEVRQGNTTRIASPGWIDVTSAFRSSAAVIRVPPSARLTLRIDDDSSLAPRAADRVRVSVEVSASGTGHTIAVSNPGRPEGATLVALGGVPARVLASLEPATSPASITGVDVRGLLRRRDRSTEVLLMARDDQSLLVGAGWSRVEADEGGAYRWMSAETARLVLPLTLEGPRKLRLQVRFVPGGAAATLELAVGPFSLGARALGPGWQTYEWDLPNEVKARDVIVLTLIARGTTPTTSPIPGGVAVADLHVVSSDR